MIYLDNSATTKVYDEVIDLMTSVMKKDYGNPSSLHGLGMDAERLIKEARKEVAGCLGASDKEVLFTSGGTESDNLAISGAYHVGKRRSNRIITTTIEHPAVLETVKALEKEGAEVIYIDVDRDSILDLEALEFEVENGANLISVMAVNNETGAMMPICKVRDIRDKYSASEFIPIHSDAVQALGKEDVSTLPADLISVSAHKVHGPKGVGALAVKNGARVSPLIFGGGQEKGLRSGTENAPGICGFGEALKVMKADASLRERVSEINKALRTGLQDEIPDIRFNSPEEGTSGILNVSFLGTRGEVILHTLEQSGIYVSTGAACSSGKNAKKSGSHVLKAMGLSHEEVEGAIRFSIGAFNTLDEVPIVVDKVKEAVSSFRRLGSFR